jgi:DNA phosphorothioation-associated DGQHR protein 1
MAHSYPFEVPAVRVSQPIGEFYLVSLPASLLLDVAFVAPARAIANDEAYDLAGTQRVGDVAREREIGRFIDTVEATFPTSVILAANHRVDGTIERSRERRWRITGKAPNLRLQIPGTGALASIVDGQHRIHGFRFSEDPSRMAMELPCSVFLDLPNPYQAYLFATVNFNQRKVDRSLAYELFGYDLQDEPEEAWSPEKAAVFLTRKLNMDDGSPFEHRIKVAPEDSDLELRVDDFIVSTATVVDGLLSLFSKAPRVDRDTIGQKPRGRRTRKLLMNDGTPLRELYLASNDKAIYTLTRNYFAAVDSILWKNAPAGSYIHKTVGVQALFDVLRKPVAAEALAQKDVSLRFFMSKLERTAHIDFTDNFFQASGKGRVGIKYALRLAMGERDVLDRVAEQDRSDYRRLAGLRAQDK